MKILQHNQPTRLRNARCAYCNSEFQRADEPQKEHVIGRLFVPRRAHERQWNLHVNSCHTCNQAKSELENDISAISMLHSGADSISVDQTLKSEAIRKSRAKSLRTGKSVADSFEAHSIIGNFGPARITFNLQSPPQVDEERVYMLALYQLKGFHYFLTYDEGTRQGYEWLGIYAPLGVARRPDWGNPLIVSFADLVATWKLRLTAPTSNGYYRVLIKKHPNAELWSWAMEWNMSFRIFGFYGEEQSVVKMEAQLSHASSPMKTVELTETIRYRKEVPIDDERDRFFEFSV